MRIDHELLRSAAGVTSTSPFQCEVLGLVNSEVANTLSFADTERYVGDAAANPNLTVVLTTPTLSSQLERDGRTVVVCDDPRLAFYSMHNAVARASRTEWPSKIHPEARIHPRAIVSEMNVEIGAGTVVEPGAVILPDVTLGRECVIRAGAALGVEGYEFKRTSRGLLPVYHDRRVVIGDFVTVGANTCVAKGFGQRDTVIGDHTKVDNLVHIAHCAHIGQRCRIVALAMIAGSTTLGDDVWIGPHASVSSQVRVGAGAFVTLGAVVTRDVAPGQQVSGNFAIDHAKFLNFLRTIR